MRALIPSNKSTTRINIGLNISGHQCFLTNHPKRGDIKAGDASVAATPGKQSYFLMKFLFSIIIAALDNHPTHVYLPPTLVTVTAGIIMSSEAEWLAIMGPRCQPDIYSWLTQTGTHTHTNVRRDINELLTQGWNLRQDSKDRPRAKRHTPSCLCFVAFWRLDARGRLVTSNKTNPVI